MGKLATQSDQDKSEPKDSARVETDPDELSQIEANLTLTMEQRLRQMVRAVRFLDAAKAAVADKRAGRR